MLVGMGLIDLAISNPRGSRIIAFYKLSSGDGEHLVNPFQLHIVLLNMLIRIGA